jgi:hypothetical protein
MAITKSPIKWLVTVSILLWGNFPACLASRRQNYGYGQHKHHGRRSKRFSLDPTFPLLSKELKSSDINPRAALLQRGGAKINDSSTSIAMETMDDAKLKALERLKTDPSSIPLEFLLSDQYLNVPTSGYGKILLGLAQSDRDNRLQFHRPNELEQPPERSLISYVIEQFDDKLVRILLVVALVSGLFGLLEVKEEMSIWASNWMGNKPSSPTSASMMIPEQLVNGVQDIIAEASNSDAVTAQKHQFGIRHILEALIEPIVITTILIINALVGGYQSLNASKGISALTQMQAQKAVVKINGGDSNMVDEVEVDSRTLVPGDVVVLTVGQKIPADIRLVSVSTSSFTVDEACLTGESDSVPKVPYWGNTLNDESPERGAGSTGAHSKGMLYGGTVITAGKGIGVVVRTGMDTEMGKVRLSFSSLPCFAWSTNKPVAYHPILDSTRCH